MSAQVIGVLENFFVGDIFRKATLVESCINIVDSE
jgi:hypothetical protein